MHSKKRKNKNQKNRLGSKPEPSQLQALDIRCSQKQAPAKNRLLVVKPGLGVPLSPTQTPGHRGREGT